MMKPLMVLVAAATPLVLSTPAWSADANAAKKAECAQLVTTANDELQRAEAEVLTDMGSIAKASSLLAAASFSQQFGKHDSCIDKAKRVRQMIKDFPKKDQVPKKAESEPWNE